MSKRVAQFGGIGGQPSIGSPGSSPFIRGHGGQGRRPNMVAPDVYFDNLLGPYQIGCDTERSIEQQLEAFHTDVEEDTIAYMEPKDRQKIKDSRYLQKRDYYRYKPLAVDAKPTYPKYETIEAYLAEKRVNDDEKLNQENEVERIKPDRIHTASKNILTDKDLDVFNSKQGAEYDAGLFGMNSDSGTITRTPTSDPFMEESTSNNIHKEGEDRYHMDAGGFNTPDSKSMKVTNNFDLNAFLNDDNSKSVGWGNDLPTNGQFSSLEDVAANYPQADNYYKDDTEPVYQEPELSPQLKSLLEEILKDTDASMEEKLDASNQLNGEDEQLQGVPQDRHNAYDEYNYLGLSKDNKFYHETEGVTNVSPGNYGSLATNVPGL